MPLHHLIQSAFTRMQRGLSLKGAAVALILAMHALGLYFLLLPARQLKQYTEVAFMTLLPPRPQAQTPPMALPMPMPMPHATPRARGSALPSVPSAILAPPAVAAETIAVPAEELPAAPPATDLRTRARLAAGAADKAVRGELKQDKPWLTAADLKSESSFQKLVASAWRGGPVIRVEEFLTADGRPATRVVSAGGATCYGLDANPGAGADPFKTGGKVKRVPCPG
jgi:hypothetical protein